MRKGQLVYLRRDNDGALTSAVTVTEDLKIDKDAPAFVAGEYAGAASAVQGSVFSDGYTVTVSDDHLAVVKVDGSDVKMTGNTATAVLDPENGQKAFTISAEDDAGNTSQKTILVTATWLKDRLIPADKVLPLSVREGYKLDGGHWSVSGDSTVYNGGRAVYVRKNGNYTFKKVD